MTQYSNENRGAVWTKRPDAKDNAPDYKIDFNYGGKDLEIAIWKRKPHDNQAGPAFRFNIEDKTEYGGHQQTQQQAAPPRDDGLDGIPF